jgi:hypothetical protein
LAILLGEPVKKLFSYNLYNKNVDDDSISKIKLYNKTAPRKDKIELKLDEQKFEEETILEVKEKNALLLRAMRKKYPDSSYGMLHRFCKEFNFKDNEIEYLMYPKRKYNMAYFKGGKFLDYKQLVYDVAKALDTEPSKILPLGIFYVHDNDLDVDNNQNDFPSLLPHDAIDDGGLELKNPEEILIIKKNLELCNQYLNSIPITEISTRNKQMLAMRLGVNGYKCHTLEEIGKVFGVTRERVRSITETMSTYLIKKIGERVTESNKKLISPIKNETPKVVQKRVSLEELLKMHEKSNKTADLKWNLLRDEWLKNEILLAINQLDTDNQVKEILKLYFCLSGEAGAVCRPREIAKKLKLSLGYIYLHIKGNISKILEIINSKVKN